MCVQQSSIGIDWPASIQAAMSVITIIIAFCVVNYQHRKDVKRFKDEARSNQVEQLLKVKQLAVFAKAHFEENMLACTSHGEALGFYGGRFDANRYAFFREMLLKYQISDINNSSVFSQHIEICSIYQKFIAQLPHVQMVLDNPPAIASWYQEFKSHFDRATGCVEKIDAAISDFSREK